MQFRIRIDAADARLDFQQVRLADEIGLVEQDHIREGDLIFRFRRVLQTVLQPFRVGHRHHRVELGLLAHRLVHEEGLRHRRRIGEPVVSTMMASNLPLRRNETFDDADQVAAHGAADAAVIHLEDFLVGVDHEVVVDADLAEFIDDHGVFLAVRLGQDAVEQRRLPGSQITGQDRDGNFIGHSALQKDVGRTIRLSVP